MESSSKRRRLVYERDPGTVPDNTSRVAPHTASTADPVQQQQQEQQQSTSSTSSSSNAEESLVRILEARDWDRAIAYVRAHPDEAGVAAGDPSPLALACRHGAPLPCVRALLEAAPDRVRHVLDARGTPLHEAVVCETVGAETIAALLRVDESLDDAADATTTETDNSQPRATLLQDVDGYTVLHLLIRRRFQSHILCERDPTTPTTRARSGAMMRILEMLVRSCPDAVVVPDRGEYEEPPIVYALKANIYAPSLGSEDEARVEGRIHDMVACMLRHCPAAASRVFTGYRGRYTALHSAVFHGRYTTTIDLLLRTERENQDTSTTTTTARATSQAALLANTQGEMPLHFSAMRGERSRTVALIARAAPEAITARDVSGLTPLHWLWVRHVCNMLALDRGGSSTISLPHPAAAARTVNDDDDDASTSFRVSRYAAFSSLEQGDFDRDLQLIKRMDPPVDFLRMRHIPTEVLGPQDCFRWAEQSVAVLKQVRDRHREQQNAPNIDPDQEQVTVWNRRQVISSLFWTKVVALLEAERPILEDGPRGDNILVHTAFATSSCAPAVVSVVAALYPEELSQRDEKGRWPIHYAARRPWNVWDFPREGPVHEIPASASLLMRETMRALCLAVDLSPPESLRTPDASGRWVLQYALDTLSRATTRSLQWTGMAADMVKVVSEMVQVYPDVLTKPDGKTRLVPFLQASAAQQEEGASELFSVSMSFELLRMNPTALMKSFS